MNFVNDRIVSIIVFTTEIDRLTDALALLVIKPVVTAVVMQ